MRIAVSPPRSESHSMRGARGDAHANEWPAVMEERHPRAGPGSAGRRVDLPRSPHERVRRDARAVRQLVYEHVVDADLAEARHVHLELSIDGLANGHASLRDTLGQLAP